MQKLLKNIIGFLLLLHLVSMVSCKKDTYVDIPIVVFNSPNEYNDYANGDTINISVSIKSQSNIASVEFTIVDENLIPVTKNYKYAIKSTNETIIDYAIVLSDKYMKGGTYQILCKVKNSVETKHKYRYIIISEASKALMDVAVVVSDGSKTYVQSIGGDLGSNAVTKFIINTNETVSEYLPYHNRLAISGIKQGDLFVFDYFTEDTIQIKKNYPNPPFPTVVNLSSVNQLLSVSNYSGNVSMYDFKNNLKFDITTRNGFYPKSVIDVNPNFLIVHHNLNSSNEIITLHNNKTASEHSFFQLQGDIIAAYPFNGNDFMIFFNSTTGGNIEKFVYDNNATTEPVSYHAGAIKSASQVDANNYLFIADNAIKWYRYNVSSITNIATIDAESMIKFDPVSQRIYVASKSKISAYSYPNGNLLATKSFSMDISDFHIIHNK